MLILPIKKKWFDMILSGEKKEEYREIKPYWITRFANDLLKRENNYEYKWEAESDIVRQEYQVLLKNGYNKNSQKILCNCILKIGQGKEKWGAEKRKRILYIRNFGGRAMLNKEEIESNRISKQIAKALRNRKRGQ